MRQGAPPSVVHQQPDTTTPGHSHPYALGHRHLNGVEAFRFNLPVAGPPSSVQANAVTDFAQKPPEIYGRPFDKEFGLVAPLPASAVLPGPNLLAVEVHNADHVQTDMKYVPVLGPMSVNLHWFEVPALPALGNISRPFGRAHADCDATCPSRCCTGDQLLPSSVTAGASELP